MKKQRTSKTKSRWGGIFNKKRFEWMEEEKKKWLQKLTPQVSIKITQSFLSSGMFDKFTDNFVYNEPLCFKLSLRSRKKNVKTII
ncbi:MAG: hypothetical protein COX07_02470 [Bacteroidetes bacterium CG23_combo_of_CG06-09_8_20_14_all_32_9]|nr:MAG: hypothetical protein COX07_02470 [Bacteroidetes bacterium CG23_combo_of_CG06-09_8_20_14_all_32_9]